MNARAAIDWLPVNKIDDFRRVVANAFAFGATLRTRPLLAHWHVPIDIEARFDARRQDCRKLNVPAIRRGMLPLVVDVPIESSLWDGDSDRKAQC